MSNEQYDEHPHSRERHHECSAGRNSTIKLKAEVYLAFIGLLVSSVLYLASIITELRLVEIEMYHLCTQVKRVQPEIECIKP